MTRTSVEMPVRSLVEHLWIRAAGCARRYVLGIAGPPGAGKSTLSKSIRDELNNRAGFVIAEIAPMDGFHLPNAVLRATGNLERKGEPHTFDVAAYLETLRRLRATPFGEPVPWPTFDRTIEEPTPAGVVFDQHEIAITEGNYLLLSDGAWSGVRELLDEAWYLDVDREVIEQRLLRRHIRGGRTPDAAKIKVHGSDLPNAELIASTRDRADLILRQRGGRYYAAEG
ncbi:nucleoside/nucleotide kinase family protein [Nocardia sp. NBC_00565]|uniref:nucleoside/nucleotide kinase family protein n=1 Tax=Nocardia sp. NBC_00565 TaxID=2975993 RepID=UPI002E81D34D|nr:nucleoside/nucleotide kinase family protein [Nocardia sp. NBC_00565]WUC01033.1 nucleoside/nucleotide kinase family protein [Nocardia sp. NBC_00565]